MAERNSEHLEDSTNLEKSSHIRDHVMRCHPDQLHKVGEIFVMRKLKACSSALQRQVREAVEIVSDGYPIKQEG